MTPPFHSDHDHLPVTTRPHTVDLLMVSGAGFLLSIASSICCCGLLDHKAEQAAIEERDTLTQQLNAALESRADERANTLIDELVSKGYQDAKQVDAWRHEVGEIQEARRVQKNRTRSEQLGVFIEAGQWTEAIELARGFEWSQQEDERLLLIEPGFLAATKRLDQMFASTQPDDNRTRDERYIAARRCVWEAKMALELIRDADRRDTLSQASSRCDEAGDSLKFGPGLWGTPIDALRYQDTTISPVKEGVWRVSYGTTATLFISKDDEMRVAGLYLVAGDPEQSSLARPFVLSILQTWLDVEAPPNLLDAPKGTYTRHASRRIKGSKHKVELGFYDQDLVEMTLGDLELRPPRSER